MLVSAALRSQCPCSNKVRVKCSQIRLDKMVIASKVEVRSNVRRSRKEKKKRPSLLADSSFRRAANQRPPTMKFLLSKYAVK